MNDQSTMKITRFKKQITFQIIISLSYEFGKDMPETPIKSTGK